MNLVNNLNYNSNNYYFKKTFDYNYKKNDKFILIIIDDFKKKNIDYEFFYKIYYNKFININIRNLCLTNCFYSFKLCNNNKTLNIIIYNHNNNNNNNNIYSIISFFDNSSKLIYIVDSYLELLLYIYKLEIELNLNPIYSKVFNKYPKYFYKLDKFELKTYFNNFAIL